ncbi:hypothetical protein P8452_21660 [Trifolium repens]|nr:hypothetical protein P8452_21660 [Trifolium repens]
MMLTHKLLTCLQILISFSSSSFHRYNSPFQSEFTFLSSTKMDWQGQSLAEKLMQIMLLAFAVIAFGTGYLTASFQTMILIYAGGVVLTTLVTVPNWPFFNRHPLKWLDPSELEKHPKPQPSSNVNSKKKPIKK